MITKDKQQLIEKLNLGQYYRDVLTKIKKMDVDFAVNLLPSLPDKDKTPFIHRELAKEVIKRFCLQMSVGSVTEMKETKKKYERYGHLRAQGFEEGFRYASNKLQKQKNIIIHEK